MQKKFHCTGGNRTLDGLDCDSQLIVHRSSEDFTKIS